MTSVPANVAPYVALLGEDRAIALFISFGGAPLYLADRPTAECKVVTVIGADGLAALLGEFGPRISRVPRPNRWIAEVWYGRGVAILELARRLHTTDVTIRRWLADARADRAAGRNSPAPASASQLDLFDRGAVARRV